MVFGIFQYLRECWDDWRTNRTTGRDRKLPDPRGDEISTPSRANSVENVASLDELLEERYGKQIRYYQNFFERYLETGELEPSVRTRKRCRSCLRADARLSSTREKIAVADSTTNVESSSSEIQSSKRRRMQEAPDSENIKEFTFELVGQVVSQQQKIRKTLILLKRLKKETNRVTTVVTDLEHKFNPRHDIAVQT